MAATFGIHKTDGNGTKQMVDTDFKNYTKTIFFPANKTLLFPIQLVQWYSENGWRATSIGAKFIFDVL